MAKFWKGFGAAYLASTFIVGNAMGAVVPALNPLGRAYAGLTWPISSTCIAFGWNCDAMPPQRYANWFFTFKDGEAGK